jgi:hypothetical protein
VPKKEEDGMELGISDIIGIGPASARELAGGGIQDLASLASAPVSKVAAIKGFTEARATQVISAATKLLKSAGEEQPDKATKAGTATKKNVSRKKTKGKKKMSKSRKKSKSKANKKAEEKARAKDKAKQKAKQKARSKAKEKAKAKGKGKKETKSKSKKKARSKTKSKAKK